LYSTQDIIKVIESRRIRWCGGINAHRDCWGGGGKPEAKEFEDLGVYVILLKGALKKWDGSGVYWIRVAQSTSGVVQKCLRMYRLECIV
jgi:hypothetical protein